nr:RcOsp1 [Ceratobasidium cereale]
MAGPGFILLEFILFSQGSSSSIWAFCLSFRPLNPHFSRFLGQSTQKLVPLSNHIAFTHSHAREPIPISPIGLAHGSTDKRSCPVPVCYSEAYPGFNASIGKAHGPSSDQGRIVCAAIPMVNTRHLITIYVYFGTPLSHHQRRCHQQKISVSSTSSPLSIPLQSEVSYTGVQQTSMNFFFVFVPQLTWSEENVTQLNPLVFGSTDALSMFIPSNSMETRREQWPARVLSNVRP